ncbi:DNA-directed RNA polymerase III subunit RPC5 [Plectropomus leopardus]|uniref:DNA-directed RNA polymerase III subunit RPC5 n=1 Tax=Plectropomus leopardus TaxID=160734 RepID=UPI001C4D321F|nr:DNA-directed RNA polymerase III subunit RPC5 [Plectropomus leopardus]
MASGDDDDPIIEEIDVYLAKSLADKLYLFQYPVRPSNMTYDDVNHLSAKIKPKQQRVELEMAIDTMSPNYCRSKGEQIALNVDGTTYDESSTYSVKMMDKQSFSSIQATTNTSRYAAAVFRKGELHVTPLTGILQMRPSFSYLDKADTKTREREAANEGGDSSQDEAEDDAKAITVRFARPESEQARQRRIQSYEFLQKKQAEEPWVHLHYHGVKDGRSEHERQYLFCQSVDASQNSELVKTPKEYLAMLMPPLAEEKVVKPVGPSNVLSMAQLRTLPLGEQVKTLMKNVKVMPFANLMGLLASGTDSTAALRCIQQVALLVQGNWVVKSDVLYPKNTCSPHSGVPAEVLCRGRDFVMWRFTLERSVMRKEIASIIKLPPEDVKEFLEHVAAPRINRGWEFLLPTDVDFIKKHPDVAHRQHMLWLGIQSKVLRPRWTKPSLNTHRHHYLFALAEQYGVLQHVVRDGGEDAPSHRHGGQVQAEQPLKLIQRQYKMLPESLCDKVLQLRGHRVGGTPSVTVSVIEGGGGGTGVTIDRTVGNGGGRVHRFVFPVAEGLLFDGDAAPRPSGVQLDALHFVLTLNEFKRLFSLHLASMPVGRSVFPSISDHMLQDAILLCQCKQIMVPFPAQSTAASDEQKVFGLWETGDAFDKHRRLLYDLFNKHYRVRRTMVQAKLAQEFGDVPKSDIDRVLNECCSSYAGMWYLKGTIPS